MFFYLIEEKICIIFTTYGADYDKMMQIKRLFITHLGTDPLSFLEY